jgi:predicted esterase YcpF (UPF0227 family)
MKMLIYLHGFNSSPQSEKARITCEYFEKNSTCLKVYVPMLPPRPENAIQVVDELIRSLGITSIAGFIGSSLGGYYSLYFQHRYQLPVVLINPAIKPYTLLLDYLGENINIYTGECYQIEMIHMAELKSLEVIPIASPDTIFLLTQTADEVLPFQQAVTLLDGAKMWIQSSGSHAFDDFAKVLPAINSFFKLSL